MGKGIGKARAAWSLHYRTRNLYFSEILLKCIVPGPMPTRWVCIPLLWACPTHHSDPETVKPSFTMVPGIQCCCFQGFSLNFFQLAFSPSQSYSFPIGTRSFAIPENYQAFSISPIFFHTASQKGKYEITKYGFSMCDISFSPCLAAFITFPYYSFQQFDCDTPMCVFILMLLGVH